MDGSKITRWETNQLRVPYDAVRRYEELLGLAPTYLTSVIDVMNWYVSPTGTGVNDLHVRRVTVDNPSNRLNELIEQACSTQLVTAEEWEEFTVFLSRLDSVPTLDTTTWTRLAERLTLETIISDEIWLTRYGSFNRLLAHPIGQKYIINACADLARDPAGQLYGETVGAMEGSRHSEANTQVISQLTDPTNQQSFYGGLLACVRKVRFGHFTNEEISTISDVLVDLIRSSHSEDDTRLLTTELIRMTPQHLDSQTYAKINRVLRTDQALENIFRKGRIADAPVIRTVTDRICAAVTSQMPHDAGGFIDRQLPILVDEILFSPVPDIRMYTCKLVACTPYEKPLARALIQELERNGFSDRDLSEAMIYALRFLDDVNSRPLIERLILAQDVPLSVNAMAARVIGHIAGVSTEEYWRIALSHYAQRWRQTARHEIATILNRLVYALGMARRQGQLKSIQADPSLPSPARSAANWWLSIPSYISMSALV